MKKKDRDLLENIKTSLNTVSENEKLPESLSQDSILSLVEGKEQSKKNNMSGKQKRATAFATVAAVFVLCVCVFFAHRAAKNPAAVVPTPKTTAVQDNTYGDAPLYKSDYEAIEQRFVKYAKKIAAEQKIMYGLDGVTGAVDGFSKDAEKSTASEANGAKQNETSAPVTDGEPTAEGGRGGASEDDNSFSSTNVQVEGVDEADIVKTDGKYLYVTSNDFDYIKNSKGEKTNISNEGAVKIVDIKNPAEMKVVSSVLPKTKGQSIAVREIYVNGNNLILICNVRKIDENGNYYWYYYDNNTLVVVYDISDRAEPKEKGRYEQTGFYLSSRLIGNRVYVFSNYDVNVYDEETKVRENCIPKCGENGKLARIPAEDIAVMRSTDRTSYLVIGSINFYGDELSPTSKAVLGGGEESYCTADTLYISNSVYDYELYTQQQLTDEEITVDMGRTEIFSFLLNEGRIEYKNYGTVSGVVNDQFSMDEHNGYFRIATTVGWNGYSIVTVLDKNLKRVGELTKIAEGEQIYSVRFMGDTAYVVTFENTDPLHVIDLSNPKAPKILGQLEIPGFSSYLHPVSDKYILGIGQDRNEEGEMTTEYENTKLSVFDISDPMNPTEVSTLVLDGYSAAQDNHKAFVVLPDGSYMIPLNLYYYGEGEGFRDISRSFRFLIDENGQIISGNSYYNERVVDIYEIPVDEKEEETTTEAEEEVDYDEYEETYYENDYYNTHYTYYNDIRRIVYANSVVYNIGDYYIEAFDLESAERLGEVQVTDSKKFFDRDMVYYYSPVYEYNGAEIPTESEVTDTTEEVETSLAETTTVAVTNG
ncbi:MAG: beta-propeller domain-containing protein [Clostridiales bacterium]|nr:beta-propeller domain-containing protein [Clostridiales bacterium]